MAAGGEGMEISDAAKSEDGTDDPPDIEALSRGWNLPYSMHVLIGARGAFRGFSRFVELFWHHFFINCSIFFEKGENHETTVKPMKINDFTPPKPPFSDQISIKISCFFWHPPLDLIFRICLRFEAKTDDLGTPPLGPSWAQNGAQNRKKGAKMLPKT